jgi:hypothetical protein
VRAPLITLEWVTIPNVPSYQGYTRNPADIDTLVFHRIHAGSPETDDAASIALLFCRDGKKLIKTTNMPYTFVIPRAQPEDHRVIIQQCVPIGRKTPHAKAFNRRGLGVGVVGDFRTMKPTQKQRQACIWIAQRFADMAVTLGKDPIITVHSALTEGVSDPSKLTGGSEECPGPLFRTTWTAAKDAVAAAGRFK